MPRPYFLDQPAANGVKWQDLLQNVEPCVDQAGFLAGEWGNCLVEATVQEHTKGNSGQAGQVIDFLSRRGHRGFAKAADKLERSTHKAMRAGGIHRQPHSDSDPQVWALRRRESFDMVQAQAGTRTREASQASSRSSGSSSGSSGSSRSSGGRLDPESKALCRSAPEHARIEHFLEQSVQDLPIEVVVEFTQRGTTVTSSKRLKSSFHSTWLVGVSPAMIQDGKSYDQVIVQIVGTQVGDQPLSLHISGNQIVKAMTLARRAGVRVADVLFTGCCDTSIGMLDFIAQEFIVTETVEDEVNAPSKEWHRIEEEVNAKLRALPILPEDAPPVFTIDSLTHFLTVWKDLVPRALRSIAEAIDRFAQGVPDRQSPQSPPVLFHQDINSGNLLTSSASQQTWRLDAVIDWESAVIAPAELLDRRTEENDQEKWRIAMDFGELAKGAWLAGCLVDKTLPRCDLEAVVENYTRAGRKLERRKLMCYEPWATLVQKCQRAKGAGYAT